MKLFEEFKRNNPYATMADFQSFRDQVSGGRNYLQGGVGNDEALRRIVQTNEAKRQQEERARQNQEALDRQTFINTLKPQITEELLNMSPDSEGKYDYAGAINNIKTMHGGTLPFDLDITNFVTEPDRQRAVQAQLLEKKPLAQAYIESLSDPNNVNAKEFAQMYSLPDNVANELIKSAKDEYNSTRQEQIQAIGNDAFDKLMLSAEKYGLTFDDAVKSLDKKYGNNELYAEWKGTSLNDLKPDFEKIQIGVVDQTMQQARIRAETLMDNNEGKILSIINRYGNSEEARKRVRELIEGKLIDTERALLVDDVITNEFDSYVTQAQEAQEGKYTAIQAEQRAVNRTLPDQLRETATARIKAYYDGKDGTFKNDPEVMAAALEMANLFYIDNNALDIIGRVGKELAGNKDMIVGGKRNALIKALTDAGQMTFDEHKAQQVELSNAAVGLREPQNFDTYYSSRFTEATEITDHADKLIEETLQKDITTEEKIAKLVDLKERTKAEVLHWNKVTDQDYKTSIGTVSGDSKYIWLDPTTPWNQKKIDDLSGNVLKNNQRIDEQIQKLQERLKEEKK